MEEASEEVPPVDSSDDADEGVDSEGAPLTTCIITPSTKELENEDPRPKPLQQLNSDNPKGGSEAHVENGKKKPKEDRPPTKVVVRRLPPSMTKEIFLQQVSPLPPVDYIYFVAADTSMGPHAFSRVYLNFINQEDLFAFTQTFDNYVFLDSKGLEYPAIVEFAPFQRVPRIRPNKKKDPLMGTLDSDPVFVAFKENILAEAIENSKGGAKTVKQHYFETEINTTEEVSTTPLLEFLKQKRAEKARLKEERREEKRKKEAERKLKQKAKEKKAEGGVEEEEKDIKGKESRVTNAQDLPVVTAKGAELQSQYLKQILGLASGDASDISEDGKSHLREARKSGRSPNERTEFRDLSEIESESHQSVRERFAKAGDAPPLKKSEIIIDKALSTDNVLPSAFPNSQKSSNKNMILSSRDKETKVGGFKKKDRDDRPLKEGRSREFKSRNGKSYLEERQRQAERREESKRKASNCNNEESCLPEGALEEGGEKPSSSKPNFDKKKAYESTKRGPKNEDREGGEMKKRGRNEKAHSKREARSLKRLEEFVHRKKGLEKKHGEFDKRKPKGGRGGQEMDKKVPNEGDEVVGERGFGKNEKFGSERDEHAKETPRRRNSLEAGRVSVKEDSDVKRCSSLGRDEQSDKKDSCGNQSQGGSRKKSLDKRENKGGKDPRTERRIRNKDRPSLEIYRPGMGKFSKQRLEKEKTLGSSTEVDSPSHSPSPPAILKSEPPL